MKPKLILEVDSELHRRLKVRCAEDGVSMSDLVRRLIEEYLKTKKGGKDGDSKTAGRRRNRQA